MQPQTESGITREPAFMLLPEKTCRGCGAKGTATEDPLLPWFCSDCLEHSRSHTLWDDIGVGD